MYYSIPSVGSSPLTWMSNWNQNYRVMSLDSTALKSYPKLPVTQSTRSLQAQSLKPTMLISQNLSLHTPYPCPASKYVNYKSLMKTPPASPQG